VSELTRTHGIPTIIIIIIIKHHHHQASSIIIGRNPMMSKGCQQYGCSCGT